MTRPLATPATSRLISPPVLGWLLFSQSLTLYVTPVFFIYMEKLRSLLGGKGHAPFGQAPVPADAEVA
jgi:HAE1 family hydrophobic/amphiphilic exporter-1